MTDNVFFGLKKNISRKKKIANEINSLLKDLKNTEDEVERRMINSQIALLRGSLEKANKENMNVIENLSVKNPIKELPSAEAVRREPAERKRIKRRKSFFSFLIPGKEHTKLEKETVKRFGKAKKKKKETKKKIKKPSKYVNLSTRIFADFSRGLIKRKYFKTIRKDLVRANLQLVDTSYISVILLTTLISVIIGIFAFVFFLFFTISSEFPIIVRVTENLGLRFLKTFWIVFVVPLATFIFMYVYPSLEKMSLQDKIDNELPFATIHMSAISSSMVNPSKIFEIITVTGEYPHLEREFKKLLNEINIYGYDLVSALKNTSYNTPSIKLRELFNGLAITINSGGDLQEFFDKRSQSLLFEYKIEMEKYTRAAETFMDIYISVVIAAPMILMLLIVMMKISGLGISLSTAMITIVMVTSVSMINIIFLTFLHIKQSSK